MLLSFWKAHILHHAGKEPGLRKADEDLAAVRPEFRMERRGN